MRSQMMLFKPPRWHADNLLASCELVESLVTVCVPSMTSKKYRAHVFVKTMIV